MNNPSFLHDVSCLQMTSTAVWLNWHVELTSTGSVSSDYETQIKCEDGYRKGNEHFDTDGKPEDIYFTFDIWVLIENSQVVNCC